MEYAYLRIERLKIMKILFTGSSAKQTSDVAHLRAKVKRIDDSSIICDSLRKQGYIVDRRDIAWGDDLSEYDFAIVGLGHFGSSTYSQRIMNALYALHTIKNVVVFHEDWKITGTMRSFRGMLDDESWKKSLAKKWSNGQKFYGGIDNPSFDIDAAKNIVQQVVDGKYPALIPAFNWGDKQHVRNIIKSEVIHNVDLTPYVLNFWGIPLKVKSVTKQKKHMLASLANHTAWVKKHTSKWDVDYFGAKSINAPQLATEKDVFYKCGEYWSILCPEYHHAGSGWFRVRWVYASIWRSIILASNQDLTALGLPKINIEEASISELKEYAELQAELVFKHMWDTETFDHRIRKIVPFDPPHVAVAVDLTSFF